MEKRVPLPVAAEEADAFGASFSLTLLTNDPEIAVRGEAAGIDHIGLDFETLGKRQRQPDPAQWVSDHTVAQIAPLRAVLSRARLFARTNPINPHSRAEIEQLLQLGVDSLMLPMFTSAAEVQQFVDYVSGRAYVTLLLETGAALVRIDDILRVQGIDEINVGLNDLHLSLGLKSHFEILTTDLIAMLSNKVQNRGVRFGFGTLGRVGATGLAIPPDLVYAQYPRLGAKSARLFRYFLGDAPLQLDFEREVGALRQRLSYWYAQGPRAWEQARAELHDVIAAA